jgi:GT2 family glycosyltransferase
MPPETSELRAGVLAWREQAKAWFAQDGRGVVIVIPSYRDSHLLEALFAGLTATTPSGKYRVIVTDDASNDPVHAAYLDRIERELAFVQVLRNATNGGFAQNVNRALRLVPADADLVLMNSDVVPLDGWLEALQYSLHLEPADLIGPKMLFADGTIQYCGGTTSIPGSRSFAHRYREKPEFFPAAIVRVPALYATGAVLYIPAGTRTWLGNLDERFTWGHDDVDYAIRCWTAGGRVAVEPRSVVVHHESATIGRQPGDPRIAASAERFWEKHAAFFERRVRGETGRVRLIFVAGAFTTQVPYGPLGDRIEFLAENGFDCELWSLGGAVHFIDRDIRSRGFPDRESLRLALGGEDAIKICLDWTVAPIVWLGSVLTGLPVFWARSAPRGPTAIEDAQIRASYLSEFTIITDELPVAQTIFGAGFEWPVVGPDDDSFAHILQRLAERPVYGDGRVIKV